MGSQFSSCVDEARTRDGEELAVESVKVRQKEVGPLLDKASKEFPTMKRFYVSSCRLKTVAPNINKLVNLVVLRITNNLLTDLPSSISALNLTELSLAHNAFTSFPLTALSGLKAIQILDMSSNNLSSLPPLSSTMLCETLVELRLEDNAFTSLPPEISDLKMLTVLNLSSNKIYEADKFFSNSLERLSLKNNCIKKVPTSIFSAASLLVLDMSENELASIPKEILNLFFLKELCVQHNNFAGFPAVICEIKSLRILRIQGNSLSELPAKVGAMTALSELHLQENDLKCLPDELGQLTSLRKLFVEFNQLEELPESLCGLNLVVLIAHSNALTKLPKSLPKMQSLLRLALDNNPLDEDVRSTIKQHGALALLKASTESAQQHQSRMEKLKTLSVSRRRLVEDNSNAAAVTGSVDSIERFRARTLSTVELSEKKTRKGSSGDAIPTLAGMSLQIPMKSSPIKRSKSHDGGSGTDSEGALKVAAGGEISSSSSVPLNSTNKESGLLSPTRGSGSQFRSRTKRTASASGAEKSSGGGEASSVPNYSKFKFAFDSLLDQQDFSTKKKENLRKMPSDEKWKLLNQYKDSTLELMKMAQHPSGGHGGTGSVLRSGGVRKGKAPLTHRTPAEYVQLLRSAPMPADLERLHKDLSAKSDEFISSFVEFNGIQAITNVLNHAGNVPRSARGNSESIDDSSLPGISPRTSRTVVVALGIIKILLEASFRSVLINTGTLNTVAMFGYSRDVAVLQVVMEILNKVCEDHITGSGMVIESLKILHEERGLPSTVSYFSPLVKPLMQPGAKGEVLDLKIIAMTLTNTMMDAIEDLEERFAVRLTLMHGGMQEALECVQATSCELLQLDREHFEKESKEDVDDMVERFGRQKVRGLIQGTAVVNKTPRGSSMLKVLICDRGPMCTFSLKMTPNVTTVNDVLKSIVEKFKLGDAVEYALFAPPVDDAAEKWLLDGVVPLSHCNITDDQISTLEFKLRPWEFRVPPPEQKEPNPEVVVSPSDHLASGDSKVSKSRVKGKSARPALTSLAELTRPCTPRTDQTDTNMDAGSVVGLFEHDETADVVLKSILKRFHVPYSDKFGLYYCEGKDCLENGTWLVETRTLSDTLPNSACVKALDRANGEGTDDPGYLLVRYKPISLNVRMADGTIRALPFSARAFVGEVRRSIFRRVLDGAKETEDSDDYGLALIMPGQSEKKIVFSQLQWMKNNRSLESYSITDAHSIWLRMRPRKIVLIIEECGDEGAVTEQQEEKIVRVDYAEAARTVAASICITNGLTPVSRYMFYLRVEGQEDKCLDHNMSLKAQGVPFDSTLVLRQSDATLTTYSDETNLYDEDADPPINIKFAEGTFEKTTLTASLEGLSTPAQHTSPERSEFPKSSLSSSASLDNLADPSLSGSRLGGSGAKTFQPGMVESATLNQLIKIITHPEDYDLSFVDTFLLTYHSFTTPLFLFTKLKERYAVPEHASEKKQAIQLRVCVFLKNWIEREFLDEDITSEISAFVEKNLEADGYSQMVTGLRRALTAPKKTLWDVAQNETPPPPKLPKAGATNSLFDIDELEIARQLTVQLFKHYHEIKPTEFLDQNWEKHQKKSPNLMETIEMFNDVSSWVATAVCLEPKVRNRAKVMTKLIKVAQHLRELNNYHLLMAFITGLNSTSTNRLKWTKARLPKRSADMLQELEELMSMEGSFKKYRIALAASSYPCIPYIGVYLSDLTFIGDGNPDRLSNNRINFAKYRLVYRIIAVVQKLQQTPYILKRVEPIQFFLRSLPKFNDKRLYDMSLKLEPRGAGRSQIS